MKNLKSFLIAMTCAAALALTACASKLTDDNLQKIHNGMTPDEVKVILGNPTETNTSTGPLGLMSNTTFIYHTAKADVKIYFLNNSVVTKEGDFK